MTVSSSTPARAQMHPATPSWVTGGAHPEVTVYARQVHVSRIAHSPSRNVSYRTYSIHITPESHNPGFRRCGVSPGSRRRSGPLDAAHNTIPPRASARSVAQIQVFRMTPALLRVVLVGRPGRPSMTVSPAVPDAPVSLARWSTGPQHDAHNAWKILLQLRSRDIRQSTEVRSWDSNWERTARAPTTAP